MTVSRPKVRPTAPGRGAEAVKELCKLQRFDAMLRTPPENHDPLRSDRATCVPAPYEFPGPCLVEVRPEFRRGAGRWLTREAAFTNDVLEAEVFAAKDAHEIAAEGWAYPVDAAAVHAELVRKVVDLGRRILECTR